MMAIFLLHTIFSTLNRLWVTYLVKTGSRLQHPPACLQEGWAVAQWRPCSYTETGVRELETKWLQRSTTQGGGTSYGSPEDVPRQATPLHWHLQHYSMFPSSTNTMSATTDPCDVTPSNTSSQPLSISLITLNCVSRQPINLQ